MLSIVIPAYNESLNIKATILELINVLSETEFSSKYEIIVVDDHSYDSTFQEVKSFNSRKIKCIRLSRRSGSHIALRAGMFQAKGDIVICISADGQDNPNIFEKLIKKWKEGNNIVWALRYNRREPLLIKNFAIVFYKILQLLTNIKDNKIDLSRADFYLLDKKVIDAINSCGERNTSLFGLINWFGFRQDYVKYERRERRSGKSKWSFRSRFRLAKDWIVAFSGLPLKLMSIIGFIVSSIGFLYGIIVLLNAISGNPIQGWTSTILIILILGGLQMIMLGIIGEYLWRNLDETRKRPLYFIEDSTNNNNKDA